MCYLLCLYDAFNCGHRVMVSRQKVSPIYIQDVLILTLHSRSTVSISTADWATSISKVVITAPSSAVTRKLLISVLFPESNSDRPSSRRQKFSRSALSPRTCPEPTMQLLPLPHLCRKIDGGRVPFHDRCGMGEYTFIMRHGQWCLTFRHCLQSFFFYVRFLS